MKANQTKHIPSWIKHVMIPNRVSYDAKLAESYVPSFIDKQIKEEDELKLFEKETF